MELFISPGAPETFLITLIVNYLKLEERGKVTMIKLSEVLFL